MKLVVDNIATLETVAVRTRPLDGYKAARFPYDFVVPMQAPAEDITGKAGEYLIVAPDGSLSVVSAKQYAKTFQRVVAGKAKAPAAKAAGK